MRIEPAPSDAIAAAASPAAMATPEPPDDPPGVRWRSQGLRVTPNVGDSVHGVTVSSGTFVLPRITAPAVRRRRTISASAARRAVVGVAAEGGHLAGDVHVVLDRDRDAEQRPRVAALGARVGLVGLRQRALVEGDAVGVELAGRAVDAVQVELGELARRHLATADRARPAATAPAKARSAASIGGGWRLYGAPPCVRWSRAVRVRRAAARAPTPSGARRCGCTTSCGRAGTSRGWRRAGSGRSGAAALALGCAAGRRREPAGRADTGGRARRWRRGRAPRRSRRWARSVRSGAFPRARRSTC